MNPTALILGSTGRFGRAATSAFRGAGWRVTEWRRPGAPGGAGVVHGDLYAPTALRNAAEVDVIVNALNPPYPAWGKELPRMTKAVIGAAKATGASVLIPGNVYNYGSNLPKRLTPDTPQVGDHRKAQLRIEMEAAYRSAGVQTIILRAGDFIDTQPGENWFEGQITAKADRGQVMYPGPLDQPHAWAFLPDLARAAEALARKRTDLPTFTDIGYPGYTLTGAELIALIGASLGASLKQRSMPWSVIRLLAFFNPMMREVYEMRYLWRLPHAIDPAAFSEMLPDFHATPAADAIRASLTGCGRMAPPPLAPANRGVITAKSFLCSR